MSDKRLKINVSFKKGEEELYEFIKSQGKSSDFLKKLALEVMKNDGKVAKYDSNNNENDIINTLTQAYYLLKSGDFDKKITQNSIKNTDFEEKQHKNESLIMELDL